MYVTISDVTGAQHKGDAVWVSCRVQRVGPTYDILVEITANRVLLCRVTTADRKDFIDVSRVLISPELIDATRRLYNLVGEA